MATLSGGIGRGGIEMTLGRLLFGIALLMVAGQANAASSSKIISHNCKSFYCEQHRALQKIADNDDNDDDHEVHFVGVPEIVDTPDPSPSPLKEWVPPAPVRPEYGVPCYEAGCTRDAK
jgi:hypothetical protein